MKPIVFNCVLLYLTVVILSVLQSRFRIIKDQPWTFLFLLIGGPILILGKAKKIRTWTELTGLEIWGWTLLLAYFNPKRIVPRVNEGYIFAYTLFHWYLLLDTINLKGLNFITTTVALISVYPTYLIIKNVLQHQRLPYRDKLVLYYWFLFAIFFTYIDQVALDIITPILALTEINFQTILYVLITAVQLYFIATSFSLLFVGIPVFHLDNSGGSFKARWREAMAEWREIVTYKLGNFVEYQINFIQFFYISIMSGTLFYLDVLYNFRLYLIFFYTVLFPIVFFYVKWSPAENLEESTTAPTN